MFAKPSDWLAESHHGFGMKNGEVLKFQPSCCQASLAPPCHLLLSHSERWETHDLSPVNAIPQHYWKPDKTTRDQDYIWISRLIYTWRWLLDAIGIIRPHGHLWFFSVLFLLGLFPQRCFHTRARLARGDTVSECQAGKPWWSEGPQEDR